MKTMFVNLYPDGTYYAWPTRSEANIMAQLNRIGGQAFEISYKE